MLETLTNPKEFKRLPLLLTYSQVIACGVREHDLESYLDAGLITYVQVRPGGRRRYRKADLARVLGLEM